MKIQDSVALVTGANRGLGLAFAQALLAGGARKVYAAARDPASVTLAGVEAIKLDVTKPHELAIKRAGFVQQTRNISSGDSFESKGDKDVLAVAMTLEAEAKAPPVKGGQSARTAVVLVMLVVPAVVELAVVVTAEGGLGSRILAGTRSAGLSRRSRR